MTEELQMYTLYHDDKPVAYRYGPPWVAQMLLMEGGYKTPEEAREAWEREEAWLSESENNPRE